MENHSRARLYRPCRTPDGFFLAGRQEVRDRIVLAPVTINTRTASVSPLAAPEAPLVSRADRGAHWFASEIQPHTPILHSWLKRRFPWLTDVDDLVQESILRVWRRYMREDVAPLQSPKAALYAIARNAAQDIGRRRAVADIEATGEIEALPVLDEEANVAEIVSLRQELEILSEVLCELPEGCRRVMTLCKMYGHPPKDVAQKLGISEHTVRAQIAKGVHLVQEHLRRRGVRPALCCARR